MDVDFLQATHASVAQCVLSVQEFHDQLDPANAMRMASDWHGHIQGVGKRNRRSLVYKAMCLVHVLMMSHLLRGRDDLREAFQQASGIALSPVVQGGFQNLIEQSSLQLPSPGTTSKWRLLLDAAHML